MERRWRDALFNAALPAGHGHPGWAGAETDAFWERFATAAPPLLALGLRTTVWLFTWLPLFTDLRPFPSLATERRDAWLRAALASDQYLARQMVETLKLVACLGYFGDPAVRRALGGPSP
ncbi:MAG: hypothetical protein HY904_03300 [Deltaproteobacteria bacterium]|nr:hypothetical protein [Deltaproteobacteria bacterium]